MPLKKIWTQLDPTLKNQLISKGLDYAVIGGAVVTLALVGIVVIGKVNPLKAARDWASKSGSYLEQRLDQFKRYQT